MSPITHELNLRTASNYIELRRTALVAGEEPLVAAREIEHRARELRMVIEHRIGVQLCMPLRATTTKQPERHSATSNAKHALVPEPARATMPNQLGKPIDPTDSPKTLRPATNGVAGLSVGSD